MRVRRLLVLTLGLLALAPARRAAGEVGIEATGHAAGTFNRNDNWDSSGSTAVPFWGWDVGLGLSGGPFHPGVLRWNAGVDYRNERTLHEEGTSRSDELDYRLELDLLQQGAFPTMLSASHTSSDFSDDAAATGTGTTEITTQAVSTGLSLAEAPMVRVGLSHTESTNRSFGAPEIDAETLMLSAGVNDGPGDHEYVLTYDTSWNRGTFVETNFREHRFLLQATTAPADGVQVRLFERYNLRLPSEDSPTNPRIDENTLGTGVYFHPAPTARSSVDYGFQHVLVELSGSPTAEQQAHSLTHRTDVDVSSEVTVNGNLGAGYGLYRLGEERQSNTGEAVGGGAVWRRPFETYELTAGAGAALGLVQPGTGETSGTYGANATAGASTVGEYGRGTINYSGSYQHGSLTNMARTLENQVQLRGEGKLDEELGWRAMLSLQQLDRTDPLFGSLVNRTALLTLDGSWRRLGTQLNAGITDGLAEPLASPAAPGAPAAAVLPVDLNTQSRFASLATTALLDRRALSVSTLLRTVQTSSPGRPDQYEHAAGAMLAYQVGLITVSLEERYSMGGYGDVVQHGNLVMARVARSFGASF